MRESTRRPAEDSPRPPRPSNRSAETDLLESACGDAARARKARRVEVALDRLLRWTGLDRAFLAEAAEEGGALRARVLAGVARRADITTEPSRTALLRAVAARRPLLSTDPARDPRFREGRSVRALHLGFLASFPVPGESHPMAALVLDAGHSLSEDRVSGIERAAESMGPLLRILLDAADPVFRTPEDDPAGAALVGTSPAFRSALQEAERAATATVPVLLEGETGSGKELFARFVHGNGRRASGPFVAVNCAALPESLLEAELFGASRGAYTGAERDRIGLVVAAQGGTLFLDEIGEMPLSLQAKILRVLQDGRVRPLGASGETLTDVRVVAATHRDLRSAVRSGAFRADLYWRLAVAVIRIPPLRERPDDVLPLASALLRRLSARWDLPSGSLDPSGAASLRAHPWPGNVRELEAVLARALLRTGGGTVTGRDLLLECGPSPAVEGPVGLEAGMIRAALREARGGVTAAAAKIGWTRQKLYRRMRALGIDRWGDSPGSSGDEP